MIISVTASQKASCAPMKKFAVKGGTNIVRITN